MADPFLAEIIMFAGNFNPRGWAFCSGQLLPISQNTALFSLLGTTYGGDGRVTFGLPDLRGRYPRGSNGNSAGPGLAAVRLGEKGGAVERNITVAQMPSHNHTLKNNAIDEDGNQAEAENNVLAESPGSYHAGPATTRTSPADTNNSGGGQPLNILDPYLGMNYIIATQGIFPSRN